MEINRTECKVCRGLKIRIMVGKYPNNKDKKYADEKGLTWNGKMCPECKTKANTATKKKSRTNS